MTSPSPNYEEYLSTLGITPDSLIADAGGSLAAPTQPLGRRLQLPLLRTADADGVLADVRVSKVLGEGGMGRVVAAEQVALGREVAIKVLRGEADDRATDALLREALVAGRLEHPNVVPVYLLGRDVEGAPLFVMRRIEGVAWAEVLRDPSAAPGMFSGARDPLEFHLEVFLEVCGAVQFAHSRGILHRDLKPDNVMLGAFREVYVVDWGLAVTLNDDPQLPRAADARGVVGTPAYMAPEMAAADAARLSPRTDVYLLGAVLYHVLTGAAPHAVGTLLQCLGHAFLGAPLDFPAAVPADLADVCRRAMHRDPAERYASADELRRAVQDCMRHRGSWALAEAADRRARVLFDALSGTGGSHGTLASAGLQDLLTECRFGYRQALAVWEGNAAALDGLQRVLEAMIGYELLRDNPRAAGELLAQLPRPSEKLAGRVAKVKAQAEARAARVADLERFRQQSDVTLGAKTRNRVGTSVGSVWGGASFAVGWGERAGWWRFGCREGVVAAALFAVMCSGLVFWLRRHTPMNDVQTRFTTLIQACAWGMVNHWLMCWALDVSMHAALALYLLWVSGGWGMAAILYDRRLLGGAIALGAGAVGTALLPGAKFEVLAVAVLATYGAVLFPPRWLTAAETSPPSE
jgi:serine/threonine-protein kinase